MKARITINITLLFLLTAACQLHLSRQDPPPEPDRQPRIVNPLAVPGQEIRHPDTYSIQLFRSGSQQSPPIIRLDSDQTLTLRFDMIETRSRQFRIRLTHHNPDWSRSPLPPEEFMEGFAEATFGGGRPSTGQRPSYRHYEYSLPNRQLRMTRSGNYMLHVRDYETGEQIFSLPFFIEENEGDMNLRVEERITPRRDMRIGHIPKTTYIYPDFVDMPQFDLSFYYTQNQFWGRTREADVWDVATPGEVFFELSRDNLFTGDYEVLPLNLSRLDRIGRQVREYRPDEVPPLLLLDIDIQGLLNASRQVPSGRFGRPNPDLDANYGNLHFSFRPRSAIGENAAIYLAGDFNGWAIQNRLRMELNPEDSTWHVRTFVKEGSYAYKYLLVENGEIRDLALDDTFTRSRQEYISFVYYRDPERHYYRLLKTGTVRSN